MGSVSYKLMGVIILRKCQEASSKILEKYKQMAMSVDTNDVDFAEKIITLENKARMETKQCIDQICNVEYKEIFDKVCKERDDELLSTMSK
jgi:hypothetical protein